MYHLHGMPELAGLVLLIITLLFTSGIVTFVLFLVGIYLLCIDEFTGTVRGKERKTKESKKS